TRLGRYAVRYEGIAVTEDEQKQMVTATLIVSDRGTALGAMHPARWFFHKHPDLGPTSEAAIHRMPGEDLYLVLVNFEPSTQRASINIVINPLTTWIWVGFAVLAVGTGIALLPDRVLSFAPSSTAAVVPVPALAGDSLALHPGSATSK